MSSKEYSIVDQTQYCSECGKYYTVNHPIDDCRDHEGLEGEILYYYE